MKHPPAQSDYITQFQTLQGDAIRNITGALYGYDNNYQSGGPAKSLGGGTGAFAPRNLNPLGIDFDASRVVPVAEEIRPNNFNIKLYIKV